MHLDLVSRLESQMAQLSFSEQLWLLERLVQRLRMQSDGPDPRDAQLAAMAEDPDIQRELRCIEAELTPLQPQGGDAADALFALMATLPSAPAATQGRVSEHVNAHLYS